MIRMIRGFFGYWADEVAHNWLLVLPIILQHGLAELALALAHVEDVLVHGLLCEQLVHGHRTRLTDAVAAIL